MGSKEAFPGATGWIGQEQPRQAHRGPASPAADSDVGDFLRAGAEHWLKMQRVLGIAAGLKGLGGPQFSTNGSHPHPHRHLSADGHARR